MDQQKLDLFGEYIIAARDYAINSSILSLEGKMHGETAESYAKLASTLSPEYRKVLENLISSCVDTTVYNILHVISHDLEGISLGLKLDSETSYENLADTQGELPGWLFLEDGWFAKYGIYPYVE